MAENEKVEQNTQPASSICRCGLVGIFIWLFDAVAGALIRALFHLFS